MHRERCISSIKWPDLCTLGSKVHSVRNILSSWEIPSD